MIGFDDGFLGHLPGVLLQAIALAGLDVVDVHALRAALEAEASIRGARVHGLFPEPVRAAHSIAGAIATGTGRGRA